MVKGILKKTLRKKRKKHILGKQLCFWTAAKRKWMSGSVYITFYYQKSLHNKPRWQGVQNNLNWIRILCLTANYRQQHPRGHTGFSENATCLQPSCLWEMKRENGLAGLSEQAQSSTSHPYVEVTQALHLPDAQRFHGGLLQNRLSSRERIHWNFTLFLIPGKWL